MAAAPGNSKITILPKITLTVSDSDSPGDGAPITAPFAEYPSAGDIWNITYNGIEYACEFIDASTIPDIELPFPEGALYIGGNLTAMGFEHAASNNDAPFLIMVVGSEEFVTEMEAYGMIMPIVTLDQTFTVSITKGSQMAPSQLTLRSNGEMVWEERTHWIESGGTVELIPVKEYTQEELETQMAQPLSPALMAGKVYEVTLGETTYSCPAVPVTEEGLTALVLGNTDVMGVPGGNPDAPFIFVEMPPEIVGSDMPYYWSLQPIDESILSGETVNFGITFSGEIIHKIDSKYLPSYDWNAEKDESGYIENRTHWTTTKTVEILPTVEVVGDGGGNIYTPLINVPSVGETYVVNWNGIDCECVAEQFMNEGITGYMFGRTKILGGAYDTGDFAIIVSKQVIATDSDGKSIYGMVMGYANMANPNVISIIKPAGAVHKLDEKYIPDTIARVSDIPVASVNGKTGDVTLTASDVGAVADTLNIQNGSAYQSLKTTSAASDNNTSYKIRNYAIALGQDAKAGGFYSSAIGRGAVAYGQDTHVVGAYNLYNEELLNYTETCHEREIDSAIAFRYLHSERPIFNPVNGQYTSTGATYIYDKSLLSAGMFTANTDGIGGGDFPYYCEILSVTLDDENNFVSARVLYHGSELNPNKRQNYAYILGNGTSDTSRSNAHTIDWNGNAWFQGRHIKVGGTGYDDESADTLLRESDMPFKYGKANYSIISKNSDTENTQWYSFAVGEKAAAQGYDSVTMGKYAAAFSSEDVAIGYGAIANRSYLTVLGSNNVLENTDDAEQIHYKTVYKDERISSADNRIWYRISNLSELNKDTGMYTVGSLTEINLVECKIGDYITTCSSIDHVNLYYKVKYTSNSSTVIHLLQHTSVACTEQIGSNVLIVGNGALKSERSNAFTLGHDGTARFAGDVYVNGTGTTGDLHDAKKVATEEFVNKKAEGLVAEKVALPKSAGVVDHGTAGQFAVSDGMGGIMWKTLVEAEEVAY